jgi:hypothetical protein
MRWYHWLIVLLAIIVGAHVRAAIYRYLRRH